MGELKLVDDIFPSIPIQTDEEKGDYRDAEGLLICGKCGTPKQRKIEIAGKAMVVPVACECKLQAQRAEEERERACARKAKANAARKECFVASGFYRGCTFEVDDGKTSALTSVCQRYADTFDAQSPYGLLLWGQVGTGKTFMSSAIANRVIDMGFTALQTDVRAYANLMESSFANRQQNLNKVLSYDLLLIEDLGAQRDTSYMMEHVFTLIDARYKSGKPMVVTTNFNPQKITEGTTNDGTWERVFDRILERCYPIQFYGENRRACKKDEMLQAMHKRLM